MKAQVQLPADQLIDYWKFCKAIAQAICPTDERDLQGMDCIVGKLITRHIVTAAPVYKDEKPPTGNELNPQVVELALPYKLTDDDRRLMETLLKKLPALRYPMSDDDVTSFRHAYSNLPNRPDWEPILITASTLQQRKDEQNNVMLQHQKALQEELMHGRLVAVNAMYVPVTKLSVNDLLPRDQAIAYLNRCGILHRDKEMNGSRDATTQAPVIQQEHLDGRQNAIGEQKLSDNERRALVALYHKLKQEGAKNCTKQVAGRYGVSDSYVRRLVRKVKGEPNAISVEEVWHKKR